MATAAPYPANTIGDIVQRVIDRVNEPVSSMKAQSIYSDVADGIESIWMSALLASMSKFSKGPVTQIVSSQTTQVVSIPDPTSAPGLSLSAGGVLAGRDLYASYCIVTESGSVTKASPIGHIHVPVNFLLQIPSPLNPSTDNIPDGTVGWFPFAGYNPSGNDQGQQGTDPIPWGTPYIEPTSGIIQGDTGQVPGPPGSNSTGDNIVAIDRIDVQNVDMTWTNWLQGSLAGTAFTRYQHKIATQTTWTPFVYDFIENRQLEVRPAPAMPMSAVYFYTNKPRRPIYPNARIPFTSFPCQAFLFDWALSAYLLGIYEYEASDRWEKRMENERQRIVMQISQGNWNQNTTVVPFMR